MLNNLIIQVGDGTTSVVLLAGEFLKQIKPFIDEGVHPRIIIKAFRRGIDLAVEKIKALSIKIENSNAPKQRALLEECAATAMNSKLIHQQREFFSKMVVDAVLMLDELLPLNMIGMKKVSFPLPDFSVQFNFILLINIFDNRFLVELWRNHF